jgi:protoporphyrinogen/coproporphyrinogen III oxidase
MKLVIVGGGVSGLSTAFRVRERFEARGQSLELLVLEAAERVGGKIRTDEQGGYRMEWGPNGFLDGKPDTLELCRDLGIADALLPSSWAASKRYVFSGGELHRVPEHPVSFFRSRLLTLRGRLRVVKEAWAPRTPPGLDTSVAEFGRRRLGREATDKLLDPMVSGIFAGDPAVLSLASCFPRIAEMEQQHGSLLRAMVALQKQRRKETRAADGDGRGGRGNGEGKRHGGPAGPGGTLTAFENGMEQLVRALEQRLGKSVRKDCAVTGLVPSENDGGARASPHRIRYRHQGVEQEMSADAVVLAVPAYEAERILGQIDPVIGGHLKGIPYAPLVVVGLGFAEEEAPGILDGFGFLVPYQEGSPVLGSLWTSSIFPARAPEGYVFTRNMVGGWRNGWAAGLDEEALEAIVLDTLQRAVGRRGRVHFRRCVRHPKAIPLYLLGHGRRLEAVEERLTRFPGIYLTGNAYRGVALNDCTREASRVARRIEEEVIDGRARGGRRER